MGYEAAMDLAGLGRRIVLACQDVDAGERAALRIRERTGNNDVGCAWLDLLSLDLVTSFAVEMSTRDRGVRALVCKISEELIKEKKRNV